MATFTRLALVRATSVALVCSVLWGASDDPTAERLRIVATTGMIGDMVRGIVADKADLETLMGEGVDPHLYKATVSDVRALGKADVVVSNGLMLEGRMSDIFPKLSQRGALVIEVGSALDDGVLLHPEGAHGHPDPHIWMDPTLWAKCARYVAKKLAERDPANATTYRVNAERMCTEWAAADARIARAIGTVEANRRVLVTAHDAFSYFGRKYSVTVMGIQGVSTESESGLADIRRLVDILVERKIPAVFVETSVSEKNVRALIEGAQARGHALTIGGSLYSDAMGKAGTKEGTYIGMIEANASTIVRALGGDESVFRPSEAPK